MRDLKYFFQFILIIFSFSIFKIIGAKYASSLSGKIFEIIGPYFRSKKIIDTNIKIAFPDISDDNLNKIKNSMWNNYGRVFAEYMFIKNFRTGNLKSKIKIEGKEILDEIKTSNKQVVFISGHFSNFELMAMSIENAGINLSTIYRPLNNIFLNKIMENIRTRYICRKQIKKGIGGLKNLIKLKNKNYSSALMIDQRVSEGIYSEFFDKKAKTTTIPAQLVRKFKIPVVPIFIERIKDQNFKITIKKPIKFEENETAQSITDKLNKTIEKMILEKPESWIWSHNRWK